MIIIHVPSAGNLISDVRRSGRLGMEDRESLYYEQIHRIFHKNFYISRLSNTMIHFGSVTKVWWKINHLFFGLLSILFFRSQLHRFHIKILVSSGFANATKLDNHLIYFPYFQSLNFSSQQRGEKPFFRFYESKNCFYSYI